MLSSTKPMRQITICIVLHLREVVLLCLLTTCLPPRYSVV